MQISLLTLASNRFVCLNEALSFDTPGTPDPSRLSIDSAFGTLAEFEGPALAFFRECFVLSGPMMYAVLTDYGIRIG